MTSIASTTELAEAATLVEGDEVPAMVAATEAEVGSLATGEVAVAAEVSTAVAAEAASAWNIVGTADESGGPRRIRANSLLGSSCRLCFGTRWYIRIAAENRGRRRREAPGHNS